MTRGEFMERVVGVYTGTLLFLGTVVMLLVLGHSPNNQIAVISIFLLYGLIIGAGTKYVLTTLANIKPRSNDRPD